MNESNENRPAGAERSMNEEPNRCKTSTLSVFERAQKYVLAMPAAVSGQRGHDATFTVACALINGFALSEGDALAIMREFSARCLPPWRESDLIHKLKSAAAASHAKPRGYLIVENPPATVATSRRRTMAELEAEENERKKLRLEAKARFALGALLALYRGGFAHYGNRSPYNLLACDPRDDWRLLLRLFDPQDTVWIGKSPSDSAGAEASPDWQQYCATRFRTVAEWLKEPECPGMFTCPSLFKPGSTSRCNANLVKRRFLVVESDLLDRNKICSVFQWLEQFSKLRAIVDTAGKSLHAWFETPDKETFSELKITLPQLGCDPALFRESQPCRLPGARRPDKENRVQSLLYLDLGGEA